MLGTMASMEDPVTPEQFVAWAEAAFGKYLPLMKAEVARWLQPHESWFIAGMRMVALEGHPSVYWTPTWPRTS
jgi:hypothetical protein